MPPARREKEAMPNEILPGKRIVGLEAILAAAHTGQDLWRFRPAAMGEGLDIVTHAGDALVLINRNEARYADFYTFEAP
jgi:hypothetical protein